MQFSTTSSPASTSSSKVSGIEEDYEPVYVRQVEVEYLENYCSGGYHPVHIGDTIGDGRYEVVHKLGYGGSSTVWLAEDHESNRIVKLKILSSSSSSIGQEHQCLEHLQKCGNDEIEHPGKRYVPSLFDTFIFEGPNGSHRCLVTEVAGCSLAYTKEHTWSAQFKVDVGRAIAARMLLGLAYIHSKGIVHGDLHVGNILLRVQELIGSTEEIYQKYGFPEKTPIERLDGKSPQPEAPLYTVQSMKTNKPADRVLCADIIISDFSDASILPHINSECGTPIHSRPPEFHLKITDQYGQAADIWTAACTLYHILGTVHLFTPFAWSREDVMIEIVSLLGPLPKDLMEKWEVVLQSDTDECGQDPRPWNADDAVRRSMQDALDGMAYGTRGHKYTQDELDDLADLLSSMLKYRPSERITADEACQSAWMQKWGLPAIARTDG